MDDNTAPRTLPSRLARVAIFVALQGVVVFILLEVVGRWFDPLGVSFYPESAAYFDTLIREEPIGYRNAPKLRGHFWGAPVSINSLGMRDREVKLDSPENEYRVMILGDSIPFGIGVSYEDSIPYRLEQRLNAAALGTVRFRTLNMGVPSYNTQQQAAQLKTLGMRLQPDLVFLFYVINDIEPKTWVLDKRSNWFVNIAQRSYAACLLSILYQRGRQLLGRQDHRVAVGNYAPENPRWIAVETSLSEISATCRAAGVPFVVFTHFGRAGRGPHVLRMLRAVADKEGFPVINIYPWEDPRWAAANPKEYQNSAADGHPNPKGSEVYAALIHEGLSRAGVLPPGKPPAHASERPAAEPAAPLP